MFELVHKVKGGFFVAFLEIKVFKIQFLSISQL